MVSRTRGLFNKIIVVMTQKSGLLDVSQTIANTVLGVTLLDIEFDGQRDWRDIAVNKALDFSTAQKVLFLEQDFLFDPKGLPRVLESSAPAVFVIQEGRVHPAFMLVDRNLINASSRDFSANPPHHDHFGLFTREIKDMEGWATITNPEHGQGDISLEYLHLNGLTQNYVVGLDHPEQIHMPNLFHTYNLMCLEIFRNIDPGFLPTMEAFKRNLPGDFISDERVSKLFK